MFFNLSLMFFFNSTNAAYLVPNSDVILHRIYNLIIITSISITPQTTKITSLDKK